MPFFPDPPSRFRIGGLRHRWWWAQRLIESVAEYIVFTIGPLQYYQLKRLTGLVERTLFKANLAAQKRIGASLGVKRPVALGRPDAPWSPDLYNSSEDSIPDWERPETDDEDFV